MAELLAALKESGYRGFLALEPHLAIAGPSSGFSGASGMRYAVGALRERMGEVGCGEGSGGVGEGVSGNLLQ